MFEKFLKKKFKLLKNQKGLTLIELLAVIVIIAIIAAIAIPAIGNIIENSRFNAVKADAINVLNAASIYKSDADTSTQVTVGTLKTEKYLDTLGKIPSNATIYLTGEPALTVTDPIPYSGDRTVKFTSATVTKINLDKTKGSSASGAAAVIE